MASESEVTATQERESTSSQNVSLEGHNMGIKGRASCVAAGLLFVASVTAVSTAVTAGSSATPLYDQFVRPMTLAAAGLGTGHYLGKSLRNQDSIRTHIAVGFFLGIFIESTYLTISQSFGNFPYPIISVLPAMFAFVLHLSPAVPNDEGITEMVYVYVGPSTTAFLIFASVIEFILSFGPGWRERAEIGLMALGAIVILVSILVILDEANLI